MQDKIINLIEQVLKNLNLENDGIQNEKIIVEHPINLENGDYSTNIAMLLAPQAKISPKELAEKIVLELKAMSRSDLEIEKVENKNGFINFYLSKNFFENSIQEILEAGQGSTLGIQKGRTLSCYGGNNFFANKKIMVDYTQPNPFKPFHIGHLMSNSIGESITRILEISGAKVVRANYQGDVGLHVAKAVWGILKDDNGKSRFDLPAQRPNSDCKLPADLVSQQAEYIGQCYVAGSTAYEENPEAKKEISEINKKIYEKSDEEINKIYDWGRKITLDAFEEIYKKLGTKFDYYFFEGETGPIGQKIVLENLADLEVEPPLGGSTSKSGIFEKSEGAIIFPAEKYDPKLHTRVFLTNQNLPTYEAKELGLTKIKFEKESTSLTPQGLDISITIIAQEQDELMKVINKVISLIYPEISGRIKYISHGMMRFADSKMSSRKGNVITGESLLHDSMEAIRQKVNLEVEPLNLEVEPPSSGVPEVRPWEFKKVEPQAQLWREKEEMISMVGVAAIKYSILKQAIKKDIIYDFKKSISFEGDSGPYLQYSYVRAKAVLEKAKLGKSDLSVLGKSDLHSLATQPTYDIEKLLYRFPEIVLHSAQELEPHYIANYLIELAHSFNTFYGQVKIVDENDSNSFYRVLITQAFMKTMKDGLYLLGIQVPDRM
ncbi:MAG: arginine--tRNA ligase [Patescibacteria group bacterium]